MERRIVHLVHLDRHNLFQLLYAALNLNRFCGLISETLYEILDVGNLFLLVFVSTKLLFAPFRTQFHKLIVSHAVINNSANGNFHCARGHIVQESAVVAHKKHRTLCLLQEVLQPLNAFYIQMVCRLIKEKHIGLSQKNLRKFYAHSPTSRKFTRRSFEIAAFKSQSRQSSFGYGMIIVAAHHIIAFAFVRKFFDQSHIFRTVIVSSLRKFVVQLGNPAL